MHKSENIEYTTRLIKCCNSVCIITSMLHQLTLLTLGWKLHSLRLQYIHIFLTSVCLCAYVCVHESAFCQITHTFTYPLVAFILDLTPLSSTWTTFNLPAHGLPVNQSSIHATNSRHVNFDAVFFDSRWSE